MLSSIKRILSTCKKDAASSEDKQQEMPLGYYKTIPPKKFDELFTLYRDYLEHEDGLINYRTTWLVSVQSFLIATFGFSYQKKFEVLGQAITKCTVGELEVTIYLYDFFLFLLVLIGIVTSRAAIRSVKAAVLAIGALQKKWEGMIEHKEYPELFHLPKVIGGGFHKTPDEGAELALGLPKVFLISWCVIFVFIFGGFYYDLILLKRLPEPYPHIQEFAKTVDPGLHAFRMCENYMPQNLPSQILVFANDRSS